MSTSLAICIAAFVVDELDRLGQRQPSPELTSLCEALLTSFAIDEQWLWDAPEHAGALAALNSLRFLIPTRQRQEAQRLALAVRTTLTEQARRLARCEDTCLLLQDELTMMSEALRQARSQQPP